MSDDPLVCQLKTAQESTAFYTYFKHANVVGRSLNVDVNFVEGSVLQSINMFYQE